METDEQKKEWALRGLRGIISRIEQGEVLPTEWHSESVVGSGKTTFSLVFELTDSRAVTK